MVRKVGFGGDEGVGTGRRSVLDPDGAGPDRQEDTGVASEAAGADPAEPTERKKAGPVTKAIYFLFLVAWLVGWSLAVYSAFNAISELWTAGPEDPFEWVMIAFFGAWLGGALVAWAFGVVILVIIVFGKPLDPEAKRLRRLRKMRRRRQAE